MKTLDFEQVKAIIDKYNVPGKFDSEFSINSETENFLKESKKNVLSLLMSYTSALGINKYSIYNFELSNRNDQL